MFTGNFIYTLPAPVRSAFFRGWQLSGITILQSGSRFSVTCTSAFAAQRNASGIAIANTGCDYNADGSAFDRPNAPAYGVNINMDKQTLLSGNGAMKAADFPAPALGQVGNLGRNVYTNPGYAATDLSLQRNFKLPLFERTGGTILQFRAEAFNAFNRVNLSKPIGDLVNVNFGRSTSALIPRLFQVGLKVQF